MRVLIVCSFNKGRISPFIKSQAGKLQDHGIYVDYYKITKKGIKGYLANYFSLLEKIKNFRPDIVHAHYGLSGLLANIQRCVPVVTTFHGSDINVQKNKKYSFLASKLSTENIFVHPELPKKILYKFNAFIIPCGVDLNVFICREKKSIKKKLGIDVHKKYALFSSDFDNPVKNFSLAQKVLRIIDRDIELIELKNYSPEEVAMLMNAVDFLIVTSFSETGPLVVKEAMACNCPIVSTDVGDVRWVLGETEGCYLSSFDPADFAAKIQLALDFSDKVGRTRGRERIIELGLDSETIARRIIKVYEKVLR